jgi:hypothetical protein
LIRFDLKPSHVNLVNALGRKRQRENEEAGRYDKKSKQSDSSEGLHIMGAYGEVAFRFWSGNPRWAAFMRGDEFDAFRLDKGADFGPDIQIRTRSSLTYDLIVYPDDPPNHRFVLALLERPATVWFAGWELASRVQVETNWASWLPRPNYLKPQRDLRPMGERSYWV